jgi:dTDP-4-amino-4,6-dideoxygalactose transaminase
VEIASGSGATLVNRLNSIPRFGLPYSVRDFAAAISAILGAAPEPNMFGLLGSSPKFWTGSGRQALRLLLTALKLKPYSGVALPLFADPSLASAIVAAGHKPVFIDTEPEFLTIDPSRLAAARGRFSVVVAVHLFGQLADMPAIQSVADESPVIEDSAHAPLSLLRGRRAGDFGLASFYSFASTKYWPAGGGGLAVVHDLELAAELAEQVASLPAPPHVRELRNVVMQGMKSVVFTRRAYGFVGRPLRRWTDRLGLLEPRLEHIAIQRSYAAVAARQATRMPLRVESQRANSLRLLAQLALVEDVTLPSERPGARYNYHMFPVLLRDSRERDAVIAGMWEKRVDTSTLYSNSINACRRYGYNGGCPVSESIASRLITLPNHASLSAGDIDRVADAFLSSLRAWRASRPTYPVHTFGLKSPALR